MTAPLPDAHVDCDVVGQELSLCYADLRRRAAKVMRTRADVDEAVQETCLRVLEACQERRILGPTRNFAFGVLRFVCLEMIRRGSREETLSDEDGSGGPETGTSGSPAGPTPIGPSPSPTLSLMPSGEPESDDDDEGFLEALNECLKQLPPEIRAFILRCSSAHGMGKVIADENGETPNAVNLRAYKIRAVLKKCVEGKLGGGKGRTR